MLLIFLTLFSGLIENLKLIHGLYYVPGPFDDPEVETAYDLISAVKIQNLKKGWNSTWEPLFGGILEPHFQRGSERQIAKKRLNQNLNQNFKLPVVDQISVLSENAAENLVFKLDQVKTISENKDEMLTNFYSFTPKYNILQNFVEKVGGTTDFLDEIRENVGDIS